VYLHINILLVFIIIFLANYIALQYYTNLVLLADKKKVIIIVYINAVLKLCEGKKIIYVIL